jgi:hypothetical protein
MCVALPLILLANQGAALLRPMSLRAKLGSRRGSPPSHSPNTKLYESPNSDDKTVELGSDEYFQGMVSRPINVEAPARVTGDQVLGPTLRLAMGVSAILLGLVGLFLFSNGILTV